MQLVTIVWFVFYYLDLWMWCLIGYLVDCGFYDYCGCWVLLSCLFDWVCLWFGIYDSLVVLELDMLIYYLRVCFLFMICVCYCGCCLRWFVVCILSWIWITCIFGVSVYLFGVQVVCFSVCVVVCGLCLAGWCGWLCFS